MEQERLFDFESATSALEKLEALDPPTLRPKTMRAFIVSNLPRIQKLVARGWPAAKALQIVSNASGTRVSERTLLQYLREAERVTKKESGRKRRGGQQA